MTKRRWGGQLGSKSAVQPLTFVPNPACGGSVKVPPRDRSVIRLPSYEQVKRDPVLYAHANRVLHLETNPGNARALVQAHGEGHDGARRVDQPAADPADHGRDGPCVRPALRAQPAPQLRRRGRQPRRRDQDPGVGDDPLSVNIMRGCFGGCTFCSITEHEGRIIQSRSEDSVIREIEEIRDKVKGFTGTISDLGRPHGQHVPPGLPQPRDRGRLPQAELRLPRHLPEPDHRPRPADPHVPPGARLKGVKKILIGSGLRYDLAVQSPEYVKELVQHHVGGYLKIAPEHTEQGPLTKMMKPGIGTYDKFKHAVREVQCRGRQEAVPDPVLHRRPPRHHR
jgi:radical SAM superfamily enzyme YgiQ (UPF0313 family)